MDLLLGLLVLQLAGNPGMINTHQDNPHYTHFHRGSSTDATPQHKGGFVLMGGGTDVDEAFQWMDERSGHGDFLILRGSGGDGYQEYIDGVTEANSVETLVIKDAEAASDPFVLERVARADAIFMAGGDQWNYVNKWKDSPMLDAINAAIIKGVPIGGTSAGLAVLGEHLFTADNGTITTVGALADPYDPKIRLASNFLQAAPLEGLITDSHFSERDRMGRLVTFMARLAKDQDLEEIRGVGVDEKTAALVEPDGKSRVVGEGGVHWVRAEQKPEVLELGKQLTYGGLEVTSLTAGQTFDLSTWTSPDASPAGMKVVKGKLIR